MNKFYRSMLFSGILAAGLAGCGDDVTVIDPPPPPPPPPAAVRSVSVAPNGITVSPGQNVQMTAAVVADPGVTATVTWQVNERATINSAGLLTVNADASSGPIVVKATATGGGASVEGLATLNVVGTTVTSVTITPPSAVLNAATSVSPAGTVQLVAIVEGTNNPSQNVTWQSLAPGVATVDAAGLVTAVAPGNAVIRATSVQDNSKSGTTSIVVVVPDPATVQIQSVTATIGGIPNVPVVLTNVFGQIEIALNIEPGENVISRVDAVIDNRVVASQTFASSAAPRSLEGAPTVVVLSTNTQQVRKEGGASGAFVPVVTNGNSQIVAHLYVAGSSTPIASNAVPVVMNNSDLLIRRASSDPRPASLTPTETEPNVVSLIDGNTYYKGTQTTDGFDYVAFGEEVPASVSLGSNLCGNSGNLVPADASALGGIALTGLFSCAGVEGGNTITGVGGVAYAAGAVGPDGTALTPPAGISTVASAFEIPVTGSVNETEPRWNTIPPTVGPNPGPTYVDNKGPTVLIDNVAFNDSFDQPWVNASYAFAQDLLADDGTLIGGDSVGVGIDYSVWPRAREYTTSCGADNLDPQTGDVFPETTVSDNSVPAPDGGRRICAYAEDILGNASSSGASNFFGVDKGAPTLRVLGATAATPAPAGTRSTTLDSLLNRTIYSIANPTPAEVFGVEALDGRSGFHQGAPLTNFPATYVLNRFNASGTVNATFAAGSYGLPTLLSDTYVRGLEIPIQGNGAPATGLGGVGYYFFSGKVTDRAGNESTTLQANFASDDVAPPSITGVGFLVGSFYTPGTAAPFTFSASDDLEVIDGTLAVTQPIPSGAGTALRYPFGSLSPLGVRWDDQITSIINGATGSIEYFLFRVDEACSAAATPYAACVDPAGITDPAPYITTSILGDVANGVSVEADTTDYGLGNTKLPTAIEGTVNDVAGQTAAPASTASFLPTQFSPQAGLTTTIWANADLLAWSADVVGPNAVAVHVASTSIVVPFFDHAALWRLYGTEWVYCGQFPAPALTDNGAHRFWTYTTPVPTTGACAAGGGGDYRVMGTKGGAGLFTPNFN